MWWNGVVKAAVERKEAALREVLRVSDEFTKEKCMEAYKEKTRKVKRDLKNICRDIRRQSVD